MFASYF